MRASIAASTRVISLGTAASRILGFVRDFLIARFFGTGAQAQAFVVAFRVPNLLRDLVAEGPMTSAIVPVLSAYRATKSPEEFWRLSQVLAVRMTVMLGTAGLLGVLIAPWFVAVIAPGFLHDPEKFALTVWLTRLLFPFITLVGLWAFVCGVLNSLHQFAMPALGPAILNLMTIAGCVWLVPRLKPPIAGVAWGVMGGAVAQLLMQVPAAWRLGFRWRWRWTHPGAGEVMRLLGPRLVGAAIYQLTVLFNTMLASLGMVVGEGAVAALYFSNRLIQLPLALFATASAQASLPHLSERAAAKDLRTFRATVVTVLRMVMFESLPASVGLVVLATPIVRVCFERGAFDRASTLMTATTLGYFALGLIAYSASRVLTGAFYALGDTRTPVRLAGEAFGLNVILALALMWPLKVGGLALATACSSLWNAWRLLRVLERRLDGPLGAPLMKPMRRMGLASAIMGVVCWAGWRGLARVSHPVIGLGAVIGGGLAVYGVSCAWLRIPELVPIARWLRQPFHSPRSVPK